MLASMGQGYPTAAGPVPIVPAAVVFDLAVGRPAWPTPADAVRALEASNGTEVGRVGAGAGTLVGRRAGPEWASPGGIGQASASVRGAVGMTVAALAVVNTVGDVVDDAGRVLAGCRHPDPAARVKAEFGTSTALLVVATNAKMAKVEAFLMAQRAQDALAVCVRPAHTRYDGDVAFSLATGEVEITRPEALDQIAEAVGDVTVAAIRQAVGG
jgi:L-aminopeptidase/D-esterase-like protein